MSPIWDGINSWYSEPTKFANRREAYTPGNEVDDDVTTEVHTNSFSLTCSAHQDVFNIYAV